MTVGQWRDDAYRMGISTSDEDRAKRQAFKRASEYLIGLEPPARQGVERPGVAGAERRQMTGATTERRTQLANSLCANEQTNIPP